MTGPSIGILKQLVRAACIALVAVCAPPAIAHDGWVDDHVAAAYDYVLGKGPAAGRGVLVAAPADPGRQRPDARRAEPDRLASQGAKRLAQCPGCAGAASIAPPRGTH